MSGRKDGSDWLDYATTPEEQERRREHFAAQAPAPLDERAVQPANHELLPREYFLVTDKNGYVSIKTSREALDVFVAMWTKDYPECLPLTILELEPKKP